MIRGIDVSKWQKSINFVNVKKSGVKFVIIKAGGSDDGFYTDKMFATNYEAAIEAGLHVGAYYFAGRKFSGAANGKADAVRFVKILDGRKFDYPVYLDIEAQPAGNKKGVTDAAIAFCEYMESKGYFTGIYASDISGFQDKLESSRIGQYTLWDACYGNKPSYINTWGMWQITSSSYISGITGEVDTDLSKYDFSAIIRKAHKNNY